MSDEKKVILRALVGSRAHGLANEDSDYDYRGVFLVPTTKILGLGSKIKNTHWIEDDIDDTMYEIGHFLHMATKCNPTVLEVFTAPPDANNPPSNDGKELKKLFPHVWNSKGVRDAFIGYGLNQRKKFLEDKDNRARKYACAYLRTLYCGYELITTGILPSNISKTEIGPIARRFKDGNYSSVGEVIDICNDWEGKVLKAFETMPEKETNMEPINEFLLKIRKKYWVL